MLASITLALRLQLFSWRWENYLYRWSTIYFKIIRREKIRLCKKSFICNLVSVIIFRALFMLLCIPVLSPILKLLGATGEALLHTRSYIIAYTTEVRL